MGFQQHSYADVVVNTSVSEMRPVKRLERRIVGSQITSFQGKFLGLHERQLLCLWPDFLFTLCRRTNSASREAWCRGLVARDHCKDSLGRTRTRGRSFLAGNALVQVLTNRTDGTHGIWRLIYKELLDLPVKELQTLQTLIYSAAM